VRNCSGVWVRCAKPEMLSYLAAVPAISQAIAALSYVTKCLPRLILDTLRGSLWRGYVRHHRHSS
jgi:hypothetical protein